MKRRSRITRSTDFKRVRRSGKSYAHPLVVLVLAHNDAAAVRIGVVAGQRVGGAVVRNLAKRRMRAVVDSLIPSLQTGWDLIFIARAPMALVQYSDIEKAITNLVKRAGVFRTEGARSVSTAGLSE